MKASKYNYIINRKEFSYWYNGVNHAFFRLPVILGTKIQNMIESPTLIRQLPLTIYNKLEDNGFIVPDSTDELAIIRKKNEEKIKEKNYMLMILPTLNCNFKCWYCIQDHITSKMSKDTIESIKRHLLYMMDIEKVDSIHIEWFGGEPFMFFKQVIMPICKFTKEECEKRNIPYKTAATTNGYYLKPSIVEDLKKLNFTRFQITLDGCKEEHDKVKYQQNLPSAFTHVLTNINFLVTNIPDLDILLRVNYTDNNLDLKIVNEINDLISPLYRNKISIILKKVWQESVNKQRYGKVSQVMDLFKKSGYKIIRSDAITDFIPCYVNREYYNTINYNGDVLKCTACNDLYENNCHGKIEQKGNISFNDQFIKKYKVKSYENKQCLNCNYLPICMGLCPRNYDSNPNSCKFKGEDFNIEDMLVNTIEDSYSIE